MKREGDLESLTDGKLYRSSDMARLGCNDCEGRCKIHAFRPGICRLFPLGRYYHEDGFSYVLMTGECKKENRTKVKIEKWIGEEKLSQYERFVLRWKEIQEETRKEIAGAVQKVSGEEAVSRQKRISLKLLETYYVTSYRETFFEDFMGR